MSTMEKIVNFSIFKEKIIKTDELLGVVLEKNKSLEKTQQFVQHLKRQLELSKNEITKLKLRNETLTSSSRLVEANYESLQVDYGNLKAKLQQLETENNNTINTLQVNYQSVNLELVECRKKLNSFDSADNRKSPSKKKIPNKKTEAEISLLNKKLSELQAENEKICDEKSSIQLELYELKKKFSSLVENSQKLKELEDSRLKLKETVKSKDEEIVRLTNELRICTEKVSSIPNKVTDLGIIESEEENQQLKQDLKSTRDKLKKLQGENENLREKNASYKLEFSLLQQQIEAHRQENDDLKDEIASCKLEMSLVLQKNDIEMEKQENIKDSSDEEIEAIMKEMVVHPRISPLEDPILQDDSLVENNSNEASKPNNNFQEILHRRRLNKRRKLAQRKPKKVDLYGALVALKKANISFVLSSDTFVPQQTTIPAIYPRKVTKFKEKKTLDSVTKELNCNLPCCQNSYMVFKGCTIEDDSQLMGFVEVKNENTDKIPLNLPDVEDITPKNKVIEIEDVDNGETCDSVKETTINRKRKLKVGNSLVQPVIKNRKTSTNHREQMENNTETVFKKPAPTKTVMKRKTCAKNKEVSTPVEDNTETVVEKPVIPTKTSFKRPVCSTRRSPRLESTKEKNNFSIEKEMNKVRDRPRSPSPFREVDENEADESPRSPSPVSVDSVEKPLLIPLKKAEKMPTSKIEMLFNKLILYSSDEEALKEVVGEFLGQEVDYIAAAVLQRVSVDYYTEPDTKYAPAPLMTDVQRTMLGFMSKLEKSHLVGVLDSYLTLAEERLLTCKLLQEYGPITWLYVAVCKLKKDVKRIRKLCCDVFYFCGDFAVPFLFMVLRSWIRVFPHFVDSKDYPIAKVLVQLVHTKDCNKPGYNLLPLKDLLVKYYGYPTERWDANEFFEELFNAYLKKPSRSTDFPLLLFCKYMPEKFVHEKIETFIKPLVALPIQDNFKATVVILIGSLYTRFSGKSEVNYLSDVREWLTGLIKDETPEVVKKCIYVCLHRLRNK